MRITLSALAPICTIFVAAALAEQPSTSPATHPAPTLTRLSAAIDGDDLRLSINNESKAKLFNEDRAALREDFEQGIMNFVGISAERHYWVAAYLTEPVYRGVNAPDYKLALVLLEEGIVLNNAAREDADNVKLHVCASTIAQRLGLVHLAAMHKKIAESAMKIEANQGGFPALDDDERKIYDSINLPAGK